MFLQVSFRLLSRATGEPLTPVGVVVQVVSSTGMQSALFPAETSSQREGHLVAKVSKSAIQKSVNEV